MTLHDHRPGMTAEDYEHYVNERGRLTGASQIIANDYAKLVMTLSGGALALSMTFIRDIAGPQAAMSSWQLAAAWYCFALAILTTLLSLFMYPFIISGFVRVLDTEAKKGGTDFLSRAGAQQKNDCRLHINTALRFIGMTSFIIGILLLVMFVKSPTQLEMTMTEENKKIDISPNLDEMKHIRTHNPTISPISRPLATKDDYTPPADAPVSAAPSTEPSDGQEPTDAAKDE